MDQLGTIDSGLDGSLLSHRSRPARPRTVNLERKQTGSSFFQPHADNQYQYPPLGIEHDEFCRDMNRAPLPHDSEERKSFGLQETFVLGASCQFRST